MISNLQQKLAAISKQSAAAKQEEAKEEVDFTCSIYENVYTKEHLIGDIPVGHIFSQDVNSLFDICMTQKESDIALSDIVFFDTETTGLGTGTSTAAFLIGVGYFEDSTFVLKQFLMNDYHQEADMIKQLNTILTDCKAVVSYNGKSYDTHIVNSRSIINRLPRLLEKKAQLDLLHSSRRLYKRRLESCSMHSIEENILNLTRVDDIPGSEIPEIFFNYVKYKESSLLNKVVEHNRQDIISMVAIAYKLLYAFDNPQDIKHREDIFSQGLIFEKLNFPHKAKLCYNILENYPPATLRLAYIAKGECDYTAAVECFKKHSRMQRFDCTGDIELAKIYEHKLKDIEKALEHTNRALEKVTMFLGSASQGSIDAIKKRKARLMKKLISIERN